MEHVASEIGWVVITVLLIALMVALVVGVLALYGWIGIKVAFAWERVEFAWESRRIKRRLNRPT